MSGKIKARALVKGIQQGEVISSRMPIAFLSGVDPVKGYVSDEGHELYKTSLKDKVLIFPNSIGSSVGAYIIYMLKINGNAPAAIINENSDLVIVSGCAISGIPLVDKPEGGISQFTTGMNLIVDGGRGEINLTNA
ncbi:MAG: aconitase X swivel domain-containing protein [Nitrososphaerales archaeon]